MLNPFTSWGGYPRNQTKLDQIRRITCHDRETTYLPYGYGRSYGDVCLAHSGCLLFDPDQSCEIDEVQGILTCSGGMRLKEALSACMQSGWIIPGIPGTQYVTIGGMIANDVHGKDHHVHGTIGKSIHEITLMRSDKTILICSRENNTEHLNATIGGLGLTGHILTAKIKLRKIPGMMMKQNLVGFSDIDACISLIREPGYTYAAAVINLYTDRYFGHGVVSRGVHTGEGFVPDYTSRKVPHWIQLPIYNHLTAKMINTSIGKKSKNKSSSVVTDYRNYFFPYDKLQQWSRLYGKKGFLEYHCVTSHEGARQIIELLRQSKCRPTLTAVKAFGDDVSPGMLSFPKAGTSLLMDFQNTTDAREIMDRMDDIVLTHQGKIYPAKDARMSPAVFHKMYPEWDDFLAYKDPRFSSAFYERVSKEII